jgi:hypothetical protein
MTDILLFGRDIAVLHVHDESVLCIEISLQKKTVYPITIGSWMQEWPQKIGELLASVYYYGTCHYLNNLRTLPTSVTWKSHGILTIRSYGCIVLEMVLDDTGCHVYLIHEGYSQTLGPAIEHICTLLQWYNYTTRTVSTRAAAEQIPML